MPAKRHTAATDPATFPSWCHDFFQAVGHRLARSHFRPAAET